jgi:hypothetical protein
MATEHSKRPSATKRGPGRYHKSGLKAVSGKVRRNGRTQASAGAYGRGLTNNTTRKQAAAMAARGAKVA